jgi:uncharacterized protein YuzB (UPF0349 family)
MFEGIIKGLEKGLQNAIEHLDIDRSVDNPEFDTVKFKGIMGKYEHSNRVDSVQ